MWAIAQVTGTIVGLITGVGTLITWVAVARRRNKRGSVPSRQKPKGAWERAAALASLTKVSDDQYIETMASSAARAAAEAEAVAAVHHTVKLPLWAAIAYLLVGVLAFWPTFDWGLLLVSLLGIAVFMFIGLVNLMRNEGNKMSIHTLVEQNNELILRNPFEALKQHARDGFEGNGNSDARIVLKALHHRMAKIRDEKDRLKQQAADLEERELALERRERDLSANWSLGRS